MIILKNEVLHELDGINVQWCIKKENLMYLKNLVKKDIPMELIRPNVIPEITYGLCPSCNTINDDRVNHCHQCGQKIKKRKR